MIIFLVWPIILFRAVVILPKPWSFLTPLMISPSPRKLWLTKLVADFCLNPKELVPCFWKWLKVLNSNWNVRCWAADFNLKLRIYHYKLPWFLISGDKDCNWANLFVAIRKDHCHFPSQANKRKSLSLVMPLPLKRLCRCTISFLRFQGSLHTPVVALWLSRIFIQVLSGISWVTQRRSLPWHYSMMALYWRRHRGPLIMVAVKSACGIYKVVFARRFGPRKFLKRPEIFCSFQAYRSMKCTRHAGKITRSPNFNNRLKSNSEVFVRA